MSVTLVSTKLHIPPLRKQQIPRPRLHERLRKGSDCKLILISAPAGFGKTTLLSMWIQSAKEEQSLPLEAAWISLDEGDNDPARFLAYLTAALEKVGIHRETGSPGTLQSPQAAALEKPLAALINLVHARADHLFLVLDDYHLITAAPIHQAMALLLDHMPNNLHLVIATRADPPRPTARLRGRGQVLELRQANLHFTPTEVAAFLTRSWKK